MANIATVDAQTPERTPARRRRPKKGASGAQPVGEAPKQEHGLTTEIEALKDRVVGIEGQLKELLLRTPPKTPRRRLRREKTNEVQDTEDDSRGDVKRLERELSLARQELEDLRNEASRADPEDQMDDPEVEEISRTSEPAVASAAPGAVTLAGSYRIPLPTSVSEDNLRAVQRGIASAQNIARNFLESNQDGSVSTEAHGFTSRTSASTTSSIFL
jgi:hypothetical protein